MSEGFRRAVRHVSGPRWRSTRDETMNSCVSQSESDRGVSHPTASSTCKKAEAEAEVNIEPETEAGAGRRRQRERRREVNRSQDERRVEGEMCKAQQADGGRIFLVVKAGLP